MVVESPGGLRSVHLRGRHRRGSERGPSDEAERLAPLLLKAAGMSLNAETDALHVAVAAVHGVEYLLSWNCRHIANATIRRAIDKQCRASGYDPPVICTPQELIER